MNTCFKVFASYNILQYMCDFIHVLLFVIVSKCRKKSQINEYIVIVLYLQIYDETYVKNGMKIGHTLI